MYYAARTLIAGLLLSTLHLHAVGPDFKEGSWHISSSTKVRGTMPMAQTTRPYEVVECLTKKDMIPSPTQESNQGCIIKDESVSASTVRWKIVCDTAQGEGTIHYASDTFEGETIMHMTTPMGTFDMHTTMHGTYLGPCR